MRSTFLHLVLKRFSPWQIIAMSAGLGVVWAGLWMIQTGLFLLMDFLEANPITQKVPVGQPLVFYGFVSCFVLAFALPGLLMWFSSQWLADDIPRGWRITAGLSALLAPMVVGLALLWLCSLHCLWLQKTVTFLLDFKTLSGLFWTASITGMAMRSLAEKWVEANKAAPNTSK